MGQYQLHLVFLCLDPKDLSLWVAMLAQEVLETRALLANRDK